MTALALRGDARRLPLPDGSIDLVVTSPPYFALRDYRDGDKYHFDRWTPAPTRPALVLDPFAGTGTTMLVASVLGRIGIGVDLSQDYARLARWRAHDPVERAKALRVAKPDVQVDGQWSLFDEAVDV